MQISNITNWLPSTHQPLVIAGPCGAETYDQVMQTAKQLNETQKISLFRAGVWKPRTRPNAFEGKGEEALLWLKDVQKHFNLKTTVEVANSQHTELALKHNVDVLWIGARTTVNPFSVQEIADVLKGVNIPIMIKNPVNADLMLWLGAIERISIAGITNIAAIHRGFHFYGKNKYRNMPLWHLPIELKTILPQLPIICDPSHICGNTELIPHVAQKALDLGMDGLMIESHYNPKIALSDAQQQLTPEELNNLIEKLVIRNSATLNTEALNELEQLRTVIDEIDDELVNILKKRNSVVEKIGTYKKQHHITIFQLQRWQTILKTRAQWAEKMGMSRGYIEKICQLLHEESIKIQNAIMNEK
jgi:chorismate mutase